MIIKTIIECLLKWNEERILRREKVYIKVTEDERDIINKLAKCQKLNTSDFVRWLIFSKYINDFIK